MISENTLSCDEAQAGIEAVRRRLSEIGKAAVVAVADRHGELIALLRLDGASLSSIVIASHKAWTSSRERKPSFEVGKAARDRDHGFDIGYFGDPKYTGWGGGVPILVDNQVVGA